MLAGQGRARCAHAQAAGAGLLLAAGAAQAVRAGLALEPALLPRRRFLRRSFRCGLRRAGRSVRCRLRCQPDQAAALHNLRGRAVLPRRAGSAAPASSDWRPVQPTSASSAQHPGRLRQRRPGAAAPVGWQVRACRFPARRPPAHHCRPWCHGWRTRRNAARCCAAGQVIARRRAA